MAMKLNSVGLRSLLLLGALLTGCRTPVGVDPVNPRQAYRNSNANPLGAGVLSEQAKYVLNRYDLLQTFRSDPAGAIRELRDRALRDDRRDILYALAESAYLYGSKLAGGSEGASQDEASGYFLFSALCAYSFSVSDQRDPAKAPFDPRSRNAIDIYNYALWQGLATGPGGSLALQDGTRKLPFGDLAVTLDTSHWHWKVADFDRFEPADKYAVRGVSVVDRSPGIGLPLLAIKNRSGDKPVEALAVTAFLRIQGDLASLAAGTAKASLELYSAQDTGAIALEDLRFPLETDTTTPLAYRLEGAEIWGLGLHAFRGNEVSTLPNGLYQQERYRPGRIPVVFVHGTASSPVWWTEMMNTLNFDPEIRQKYQFWYFVYTSSAPVLMSAASLRDALRERVASLDPKGRDPALREMVVVGHSQGGLLTKLTAVATGDRLVQAVLDKPIDEMNIPEADKVRARHFLVVEPLPFVKEVIFMSTPHRGSYRSKWWNRNLVKLLVKLPATVVDSTKDYFSYMNDDVKKLMGGKNSVMTSADGQSTANPMLKALAGIPLAPGVDGHSIIAVRTKGDPKLGDDGVVKYTSAHLEGMKSELVVRSGHSSQLNPLAIDEVRRILLEHLAERNPAGGP